MTNHFIFTYLGNKRNEFKHINNVMDDIDNYDTIIEPFCGTSAISFNIWLKHPNKKFILNDNNGNNEDILKTDIDPFYLKKINEEINIGFTPF